VTDHRLNYTATSKKTYFLSANVLKRYEVSRVHLARRRARVPRDKPLTLLLSRCRLLEDFVYTSAIYVDDTVRT